MSRAGDLAELECLRRLYNATLGELRALEEQMVPAAPEETAELVGRAFRLRLRLQILGEALHALAKKHGVRIVDDETVSTGGRVNPSVH